MNKIRWNPYVLIKHNEITSFWSDHFKVQHKLLFILGKGFDTRMNTALDRLMTDCPDVDIIPMLIEFDEGRNSASHALKALVDGNMVDFTKLTAGKPLEKKPVTVWERSGRKRKRVGDRQAADLFPGFDSIKGYSDIIVDISSLPRGVYFSLIGKLLKLIDSQPSQQINLFIITSENVDLDAQIQEEGIEADMSYLFGFSGDIDLVSGADKPIIWLPILGENKEEYIKKAFHYITDSQTSPHEICTVLPFPSKDARRVDSLIVEYHKLLFDELAIESQNIIYVPERNPFEAYVRLVSAIQNYSISLQPLGGCRAVISTFSSKLLSIGALLAAYELKQDLNISVGVLNVDSDGYKVDDHGAFKRSAGGSELFLTWLTGSPYSEQEDEK